MPRLAGERDKHLTREEIAVEALRQFTETPRPPSIRSLAKALGSGSSVIYHHFESREEILAAAVDLVWEEAAAETLRLAPAPFDEPPADVLLAVGLATRRTWLAHHRLAPFMAARPGPSDFSHNALALMENLFSRLELPAGSVESAFHSYSSFMIGAVLFAASRRAADDGLGRGATEWAKGSLGEISGISSSDPDRDEALFKIGLERLIASFSLPSC